MTHRWSCNTHTYTIVKSHLKKNKFSIYLYVALWYVYAWNINMNDYVSRWKYSLSLGAMICILNWLCRYIRYRNKLWTLDLKIQLKCWYCSNPILDVCDSTFVKHVEVWNLLSHHCPSGGFNLRRHLQSDTSSSFIETIRRLVSFRVWLCYQLRPGFKIVLSFPPCE